jgi:hypothetical protein
MDGQELGSAAGDYPDLLNQLAHNRRLSRLTAIHPAAGQIPAANIGVLYQEHLTLLIQDQPPHAQGHASA